MEREGVSKKTPGEVLSEQLSVPMPPKITTFVADANKKLPPLMTFQRKEVRMFSDGRMVGLYREMRTGVELVFPTNR